MCGISGFISKKRITKEILTAMNDTMYHRGPDDGGVEIYDAKDGYSVGLAQRRLSILDLSALGHQPMHSADGRVSIVYNGEIYNFLELREELADYPFKSQCDTEVILAAYLKWGISCLEKFNGMFAIALFDRETNELFLVRDRIGKKPLYYWLEEEQLVFASELKALMAHPDFQRKIRRDILPKYLYQQYIPEPETVFENVYKVMPGGGICFFSGKAETFRYWSIAESYKKGSEALVQDYDEAKEVLKSKLQLAVKRRMIADVPLGAFLSGGYDSSLMTAMAQEKNGTPVKTFSIGFEQEAYNEAGYAQAVAEYLGCDHTQRIISTSEMFELVESISTYYDEPFADSSQIPSMLVSALAKERVTVALSGDGGDEFFCGYQMYDKIAQAQKLDGLGNLLYYLCQLPGAKQADFLSRLPFKVRTIAKNRDRRYQTQLVSDNYLTCIKGMTDSLDVLFDETGRYETQNWQIRRMLLDMDTYLPGDILCKVDRASMKYSLEARCPILDKDVMEYSFRLPQEFKYHNGIKKRILKDIAYDYLPKELLERPKKGFSVPMDQWLRGPLKEKLTDYASMDFLSRQGIFDARYTNELVNTWLKEGDAGSGSGNNYSRILWAFFAFEQWYEKWMV